MRHILKALFWFASVVVYRIKVNGKENIPKEGPVLLCPNHVHALDSVIILMHTKRQVHALAKDDLFNNKILNWLAKIFGIYPIKPESADIDAIKTALRIFKNNEVLMIFPEGTRNGMARGVPLKNGPVTLAIKSGTPIVPIGIKGNFKAFSKIVVNIGKPRDYSQYKDKLKDKEFISNLTKELMDEVVVLRDK